MKINKMTKSAFALTLALSIYGASASHNVNAAKSFTDIKQGAWYENAVEWGISKDMIKGYQDGTFKPNKTVSEAEFLAMLLRAFEPNLGSNKYENWTVPYYERAKELNYPVKSYENSETKHKPILRKNVAELISATEGVNYSGDNAIHYLLAFGLADGTNPNEVTVENFKGEKELTRAEAIKIIKNFYDYGIGGLLERPKEPSDPKDLPPIRL
ncbi:S-layer homology domain-containing protein (plasmid) [Paenibacillus thiaminolyticus]|uniref:S-layer homology domain-containing protein n=1 Tax=Paenibacillus thiaminolyticus TaxID=49283 RepID=UPI00232AC548|nr:S-layer homology domain-containing protein [Paenibacillus thiaminolyticus]WCF11540.1 S-layer homology domain-containing protein [Paenibacillus thiaminolyticus]